MLKKSPDFVPPQVNMLSFYSLFNIFTLFAACGVALILRKWSFMLKIASLLQLKEMVVKVWGCAWVNPVTTTVYRALRTSWRFTSADVEVGRWPQREHESGCRGGRLGDRPRLWGSACFLECCPTAVEDVWTYPQQVDPCVPLCCRTTSRSRSRGGGPRLSRARDVRSTSGKRRVCGGKPLLRWR